jgi:hypothetical protein
MSIEDLYYTMQNQRYNVIDKSKQLKYSKNSILMYKVIEDEQQ